MALGSGPLPVLTPDHQPQPGWADLRDQAAALLAQQAALLDQYDPVALEIAAETCSPDLGRRVTGMTRALLENRTAAERLGGQLDRVTYEGCRAAAVDLEAAFEAGQAAERARQAALPGRHRRAAGERRGWLGVIDGGRAAVIPAAAAAMWQAARAGVQHHAAAAWSAVIAHKAAAAAIAAAAVTATASGAYVALAPPAHGHAAASGHLAGQVTNGAGDPGASLIPAQQKPGGGAKGATKRRGHSSGTSSSSSAPIPPYNPGPVTSPPSSPSQPPASSPPAAGSLVVTPQTLDLTAALSATVRIRAWGGPVSWSIPVIPADLVITLDDGTLVAPGQSYPLGAGQTATLTVAQAVNLDGLTLVTFEINGTAVSVTLPQPPQQSPSPAASSAAAAYPF